MSEFFSGILDSFGVVWGALLSFGFMDFVDVLLVTFVVYEGIKLIRGSRSFQLFKGLMFLGVIFLLVKVAEMNTSYYILSYLVKNGVLILVVLFAPELRNILEKFGRRRLSAFGLLGIRNKVDYTKVVSDTINDFCKAAGDMSETKTGALVVFEKDSPLQDIIGTGTVIDAKSSPELFGSLFFKNSALHDGAVIVRDGKIYSAGCILPLTKSANLDSELGTRHRAAIGMSEDSDAVVVVVSEETGDISVAVNGRLQRKVEKGRLREILLDELIEADDSSGNNKFFGRIRKDGRKGGNVNEKDS